MVRPLSLLLVVLLATSTASIAVADTVGRPVLSVHLPDHRVAPGDEATLEVYLQNRGEIVEGGSLSHEDRVTTARDVVVTLGAGAAPLAVETAARPVGNVPEGRVGPVPFVVMVEPSAAPGTYELPVTVDYHYTRRIDASDPDDVELTQRDGTLSTVVTVVVEPRARFGAVGVTTDANLGEEGDVTVRLENVGSDLAGDARVTLESRDGALTFGGSTTASVFVGDWPAGAVREVTVTGQFAAGSGLRSLPVAATIAFEDADGDAHVSEAVQLGVTPRTEQTFALGDLASTLAVGDEGTLSGTVTNTGGTTVRNAVVVFSAEDANVVPIETEYAIGDLAAGQSAAFAFDAEVSDSAGAGPRQLSLVVRYRDAQDDVRRSDPLDANVEVGPRRDIFAVEPVSASFDAGSSGVLELRIRNDGPEPVTDVSAKLFADDPLSTDDDEAFVDTLAPGESTVIRFGLAAAGDAIEDKVYPVSLDFQYDDADGDTRLSDTYDVPVRVTGADGGGPGTTTVVGLVALVVLVSVGAVWYWRRR